MTSDTASDAALPELRALSVLPARREDIELHTADQGESVGRVELDVLPTRGEHTEGLELGECGVRRRVAGHRTEPIGVRRAPGRSGSRARPPPRRPRWTDTCRWPRPAPPGGRWPPRRTGRPSAAWAGRSACRRRPTRPRSRPM